MTLPVVVCYLSCLGQNGVAKLRASAIEENNASGSLPAPNRMAESF